MEPTSHSRSSIYIGATVAKHSGIVQQLIAADAVSGCDTVGCRHGIIKMRLLKPCRQELPWTIWEIQKLALMMSWRSPHILSVHAMNRIPIHRHNASSPLQSMGITHWAKWAQYPSETKVTATYYGSLLEIRETKVGLFSSLYLESCIATVSTRSGSTWVW